MSILKKLKNQADNFITREEAEAYLAGNAYRAEIDEMTFDELSAEIDEVIMAKLLMTQSLTMHLSYLLEEKKKRM